MAYEYYQSRGHGWGTDQYEFVPPPRPSFQPQPSWGGYDYFRAHAISPDPSLYDYASNRVRDYPTSGAGYHEAKIWHNRAYSGQVELSQLSPYEIGHAAAYEACRNWRYNNSLYESIGGDYERQREALIGLAMAEATRLWHYSGRALDRGGREAACEAAAATAQAIYDRQNLDDVGPPPLRRRNSYSSFPSTDPYDHDYDYDYDPAYPNDGYSPTDPYRPPGRRYSSSSSRPPPIQYASSSSSIGFPPMGANAPVPIQPSPSAYSLQRRPSFNAGYLSGGVATMPAVPAYGPVSPTYSPYGSPNPGGFVAPPVQQQPYTVYSGGTGYQVPAGSTVIIQNRSRKHSHRHRRHSTVKY